ncbi:hypothetical protein [Bradyrhizobium yuanmingense]|uniref:hypothetical protein n=1 Tax=Bradyrhizobium yuanmingense TaxID=108015 RepID=UPI0023BA2C79|nr:hypothetical protein [Bradyrhizobium yuanmingense]MDF0584691.1 hypothetical protein [Bradyrhizobium yuanmingense]
MLEIMGILASERQNWNREIPGVEQAMHPSETGTRQGAQRQADKFITFADFKIGAASNLGRSSVISPGWFRLVFARVWGDRNFSGEHGVQA